MTLSMDKGTATRGGKWRFLLNWDQKVGKQTNAGRGLARLTGGKINLGGKPKESDVDIWAAFYRDRQPKRVTVGWNPNAVPGASHTGDNQTGAGDDDEAVTIDFDAIPAWVTEVVVGVSTKPNGSFGDAMNVGVKVFEGDTEVDELMPTLGANQNVAVTLVAKRNKDAAGNILDGWEIRVLDAAGRYSAQIQQGQSASDAADAGILSFAKSNAGF
ncbi:tellurium resistance protein D family protein [Streptomyces phage Keanu]|nr:tellurium resistance protein D family protein [Streptomyces phage Keanu]